MFILLNHFFGSNILEFQAWWLKLLVQFGLCTGWEAGIWLPSSMYEYSVSWSICWRVCLFSKEWRMENQVSLHGFDYSPPALVTDIFFISSGVFEPAPCVLLFWLCSMAWDCFSLDPWNNCASHAFFCPVVSSFSVENVAESQIRIV